jgi:hypothetical protein
MPKAKFDPLENAKVTDQTMAQDDAALAKSEWSQPAAEPDSDLEPPEAPALPTEPPAPKVLFEVTADQRISLGGGQVHLFKVGTILDAAGYGGEEGIEKLGLKLRRI